MDTWEYVLFACNLAFAFFIVEYVSIQKHSLRLKHLRKRLRRFFYECQHFKECKWNVKKDTLVIIGNGFDLNEGLATSYSDFSRYYKNNIKRLTRFRWWNRHVTRNDSGDKIFFTDVELVYGDVNHILNEKFWSDVELSMGAPETKKLEAYYAGKLFHDYRAARALRRASKLLRYIFSCWIASINCEDTNSLKFGDNCIFMNFNYTDTLTSIYGINPLRVMHIHGNALSAPSIVLGHRAFIIKPEKQLKKSNIDDRKVYRASMALYLSSKDTVLNYAKFQTFLAESLHNCKVNRIFILGKKIAGVDSDYFKYIVNNNLFQSVETINDDTKRLVYGLSPEDKTLILCAAETREYNRLNGIISTKYDEREYEILGIHDFKVLYDVEKALLSQKWKNDNREALNYYRHLLTESFTSTVDQNIRRGQFPKYSDWSNNLEDMKITGFFEEKLHWYVSCHSESDKKENEFIFAEMKVKPENIEYFDNIEDCIRLTSACDMDCIPSCSKSRLLNFLKYYTIPLLLFGITSIFAIILISVIKKMAGPGPSYCETVLRQLFE